MSSSHSGRAGGKKVCTFYIIVLNNSTHIKYPLVFKKYLLYNIMIIASILVLLKMCEIHNSDPEKIKLNF